jgi:glycosyltransferase involved in cell wall biosynthesis
MVVRLLRQQIVATMDRERVDVVYAHSPALCGLAALQAARIGKVPCVYEIRAFWEDAAADRNPNRSRLRSRLTHSLETYVARHADAVAAIAKPMLQDLRDRGISPEKLFHVPNGTDTNRLRPIPKDEDLARDLRLGTAPVLGFFGSLYRYEGVSWLIEPLTQLRRTGKRFQLLIVGRGEDEGAIREAIREHCAEEWVRLVEHVPHEEIGRYYSVVDIAVYPRRSSRLTELVTPLKPLEAMAFGKPILGSSVGGIRELVQHERTGLLFKPEVAEDFREQALRLLGSSSLRESLGEQGREFVVAERDWNVIARHYSDIYAFVLSPSSRRGPVQ